MSRPTATVGRALSIVSSLIGLGMLISKLGVEQTLFFCSFYSGTTLFPKNDLDSRSRPSHCPQYTTEIIKSRNEKVSSKRSRTH